MEMATRFILLFAREVEDIEGEGEKAAVYAKVREPTVAMEAWILISPISILLDIDRVDFVWLYF